MAYSSETIIQGVLKHYPEPETIAIKNCTDLNLSEKVGTIHQYILGITEKDKFSGDVHHYENWIKKELSQINANIKCLAWMFEGDEIDELKSALVEVAEYFNSEIDIEKILTQNKIKKNANTSYFLVITVVQYPIIYT